MFHNRQQTSHTAMWMCGFLLHQDRHIWGTLKGGYPWRLQCRAHNRTCTQCELLVFHGPRKVIHCCKCDALVVMIHHLHAMSMAVGEDMRGRIWTLLVTLYGHQKMHARWHGTMPLVCSSVFGHWRGHERGDLTPSCYRWVLIVLFIPPKVPIIVLEEPIIFTLFSPNVTHCNKQLQCLNKF